MSIYKNCEGYDDPTAGEAISNIIKDEKRRTDEMSTLILVMKKAAELAGFEVIGRIVLQDKKTGKIYK